MDAKQAIFSALRKHAVSPVALPDLAGVGVTYPDRRGQFSTVLAAMGGRAVFASTWSDAAQTLDALPVWKSAKKVYSAFEQLGRRDVDVDADEPPHALADVDFAVLPGEFAVAENGAVWTRVDHVRRRALYFLAQHVALVVPGAELVDNMHQAYARLRFTAAGFGVFIAGPSKTADIEQSLVIGAHGARSLTVLMVDELGAP